MEKIRIRCISGLSVPLDTLQLTGSTLKKHSLLEIQRLEASIIEDGFLFPLAISELNGISYVVDGECRYHALMSLANKGYEIPEVPIFYVACTNEDTLKRNILMGASTNHAVTAVSLKRYADEKTLNKYAFATGDLIDFFDQYDMDVYEYTLGGKFVKEGVELKPEQFEGLLK